MFDYSRLSPKNPAYLKAFVQQVIADRSTPDSAWITSFHQASGTHTVVLLPGSYIRVPYMTDFARGFSQTAPEVRLVGVDYPTRREMPREARDAYGLADYTAWVLHLLRSLGPGPFTLIGHSMGTLTAQYLALVTLVGREEGVPDLPALHALVILGGGPPKLGWRDYLASFTRPQTLGVVMQMINDPESFAREAIALTLADAARKPMLDSQGLIFPESKRVMRESFTSTEGAFIPAPLLDQHGVRRLIIGGDQDLFVTPGTIRRAFAQWGGDQRMLEMQHTDLVMGPTGQGVGAEVAAWWRTSHPSNV